MDLTSVKQAIGRGNRSFGQCKGYVFVVENMVDESNQAKNVLIARDLRQPNMDGPVILSKALNFLEKQ